MIKKTIKPIKVYGGIYEANPSGSPITITIAGTYYQWVTIDGNSVAGTGYCEYDSTNKQLIVKKSGWYNLSYKTVFSAKVGSTIQLGVFRTPSAGSPAVLPAFQGWSQIAEGKEIYPTSQSATFGVLTGAVSRLQENNRLYVTGSEVSGNPGYQYQFTFVTTKTPLSLHVQGKYIHSTQYLKKWEAYNFDTASWVEMIASASVADDMPDIGNIDQHWDYLFPSGTYLSGGEIRVRTTHTSNGANQATALYLDSLHIRPKYSRSIATVTYPAYLEVDDRLDMRFTSDESGEIIFNHISNLSISKISE